MSSKQAHLRSILGVDRPAHLLVDPTLHLNQKSDVYISIHALNSCAYGLEMSRLYSPLDITGQVVLITGAQFLAMPASNTRQCDHCLLAILHVFG